MVETIAVARLDRNPEWSDDGSRIAFDRDVSSDNRDVRQLYIMNPDGTNVMPVTSLPSSNGHAAWRAGPIR